MTRRTELTALDLAVAKRIRALAGEQRMTQKDIAEAADIPTSTFGRYWNQKQSMTLGDLERILAALGTTYAREVDLIRKLVEKELDGK